MRLWIVLLIGAAFYFLLNLFFRKNWYKGLTVSIDFEKKEVREGDKNTLTEVVRNDKAMPLPVALVKFSITRTFLFPKESNSAVTDLYYRNEYFSLWSHQIITRKYGFTASKRGEYSITSLDLVCKDFFLFKNVFAGLKQFTSVLVLPGSIRPDEVPDDVLHLTGEIVHRNKLTEDPFAFHEIREYQPYDPVNHINWKATAKSEMLQVNTFHTTNRRNVTILLNLETGSLRRGDVIAEAGIKIASYLTGYFIQEGIPVAIYTNSTAKDSEELIYMEEGGDEEHIHNVDVALAHLELKEFYPSFLQLMKDRIEGGDPENDYLIVSNDRREELITEYKELQSRGFHVSFIIPDYEYVSVKHLMTGDSNIVKWGIDDEG